jgi:hypothetical protein
MLLIGSKPFAEQQQGVLTLHETSHTPQQIVVAFWLLTAYFFI